MGDSGGSALSGNSRIVPPPAENYGFTSDTAAIPPATPAFPQAMTAREIATLPAVMVRPQVPGQRRRNW